MGRHVDDSVTQVNNIFFYFFLNIINFFDRLYDTVDPYISVYSPPKPFKKSNMKTCYQKGFISNQTILELLQTLVEQMKKDQLSFACLSLHGFEDNLISWHQREHGFLNSGENDTVLIVNKSEITVCQIVGPRDLL
jgi:hypothetical protein